MSSLVISTSPSISIVWMFKDFLNIIKTRFIGILLITLNTLRSNKSGTLEFFISRLSSDISSSSLLKLQFSKISVFKFLNNGILHQNMAVLMWRPAVLWDLNNAVAGDFLHMAEVEGLEVWPNYLQEPCQSWGEEVSAPGLKVLDVIKDGQLGRALLVRTVRRGIYLEVVGEIFRVVFENHSLNIWTGLSYQCHLFIWMEMYFLWGLKYLQLQFLLKCPSCFINEGLVAESFTQRNSSL